jgi:hypothetical protein
LATTAPLVVATSRPISESVALFEGSAAYANAARSTTALIQPLKTLVPPDSIVRFTISGLVRNPLVRDIAVQERRVMLGDVR